MTTENLLNTATLLTAKYKYKVVPLTEQVIALSVDEKNVRIIIAKSADEDVLDIAFSPITPPSEVASIIIFLIEEGQKVNITKDFYFGMDKEMYMGIEAMTKFAEDIYILMDEKRMELEGQDDDDLLESDIYVTTEPIEVATVKKMKKNKLSNKYTTILERKEGK